MSDKDDSGVRVSMRAESSSDDAVDEWEGKSVAGGDATAIDPRALDELRKLSAKPTGGKADDFKAAADEFGEGPATVTESVEEVTPDGFIKMVSDADDLSQEFDEDSVTRMDPRAIGKVDEAADDAVGKEPCPKCGVMVAPGYPKCPRCQHRLVGSSKSKRAGAGGTTVVGRTVPWAIVFVAAVLTAIIVYLAERDVVVPGSSDDGAASEQGVKSGQPTQEAPVPATEDTEATEDSEDSEEPEEPEPAAEADGDEAEGDAEE